MVSISEGNTAFALRRSFLPGNIKSFSQAMMVSGVKILRADSLDITGTGENPF